MEIEPGGMIYEDNHISSNVQNNKDSGIGSSGTLINNVCLQVEPTMHPSEKHKDEDRYLNGEIFHISYFFYVEMSTRHGF